MNFSPREMILDTKEKLILNVLQWGEGEDWKRTLFPSRTMGRRGRDRKQWGLALELDALKCS